MAKLTSLSNWLNEHPQNNVAVQMGTDVTADAFVLRVQLWMDALRDQQGVRWAVHHSDALEFLAIMFALWQLQRTACVPGDNRPGTVQRLTSHVDGFVGDFPVNAVVTCCAIADNLLLPSVVKTPGVILKPNFIALEVYTSGSTGDPQAISKTIEQLEEEVRVLESQWPSQPESVVLATVSHQHLYGMTFRLFWPLSSGRAFESKICEYTEDILHQARHYSVFSLVSSPSHLGRMNTSVNWAELNGRCDYILSSAAPLARQDSLTVSQLLAAPVREIYGSSETGAIAWRIQQASKEDALWQPLPEVILSLVNDGSVSLKSPYLGALEYFTLPDRLAFKDDGSFKLIGRVDRIVKVEGKRLSLAAIERLLLDNCQVKNAKALLIERKRVETAVVIELSEEGAIQLHQQGRQALIKILKMHLAEHFEAVVLPRRWRFVEQMPYNPQGKLPLDTLLAMFEKDPVKWPKIIDEQLLDNQVTMRCFIPQELIYFDGHFDDFPILPGIVQVHWAEAFGRRLLPVTGQFKRLEVIKFQQVIPPDYEVTVTLKYDEVSKKLTFQYLSEKGVHSSGRICFG